MNLLEAKGRELGKVLAAFARWGDRHIHGTVVAPEFRRRRGGANQRK